MRTFQPGTRVIALSSSTTSKSSYSAYTLAKEIQVLQGGIINTSFELRTGRDDERVYGKIYVNGIAVGTERSNKNDNWVIFNEDIPIQAGDKVQLYVKGGNTGFLSWTVDVRNFKIMIGNTVPGATVLVG